MAFEVETGEGSPTANSYASVDAADEYFTDRNRQAWLALTIDQKQSALIDATDYIDLRWGKKLLDIRAFPGQALEFPRVARTYRPIPPVTAIALPVRLLRACFEYAIIASNGPLAPNPEMDESGRIANTVREKVGPIEEEKRWDAGNTTSTVFRPYSVADQLMSCFIRATNGGVIR